MEDGCNFTFASIEGNSSPLAEGMYFVTLDSQVLKGVGDGSGVICIAKAACAALVSQLGFILGVLYTAKFVAPATSLQPSVQGLNKDEKEEGGEGVPLNGAPGDRDVLACLSHELDGRTGSLIYPLDDFNSVSGEA